MALMSLWPNLFSGNTFTLSGGTEAEYLAKRKTHAETPATNPIYTSTGKSSGLAVSGAGAWVPTGGGSIPKVKKVLAVTMWVDFTNGTVRKFKLEVGGTSLAVETPGTNPGWKSVELAKAEAEALTQANLESLFAKVEQTGSVAGIMSEGPYLEVEYEPEEEGGGHKVAASSTAGAVTSANAGRIAAAAPSLATGAVTTATVARLAKLAAGASSGAVTSASTARLAKLAAQSTTGASVSVGAIVKSERGPQSAKLSSGAVTAATVARKALTPAAATAGALVRAQALRQAQRAASASSGAVVSAQARRAALAAPRVSGGAVVTATVRRVAKVAAVVSSSALTSATISSHGPKRASVSSGVSVYATIVRGGVTPEPPTSTPIAGHVAIGQRGTIGVHRGRLPTRNIGRAER